MFGYGRDEVVCRRAPPSAGRRRSQAHRLTGSTAPRVVETNRGTVPPAVNGSTSATIMRGEHVVYQIAIVAGSALDEMVSRLASHGVHWRGAESDELDRPASRGLRVRRRLRGGSVAKKSHGQVKAKRSRPAATRDLVRRAKASAYVKRTASGGRQRSGAPLIMKRDPVPSSKRKRQRVQ